MIGIIGGGFGLYGWLPALCQYYPNEKILLESRHKEKFDKRPELQQYKDRIEWLYYTEIIMQSELLVLAIPPYCVYEYLDLLLYHNSVKKLIVEKPVCETPEKSEDFIKQIEAKGIKICSSYLFIYTDWFKKLDKNEQYHIIWNKPNTNPLNSWKHYPKSGGGKIFYLIHLLAVSTYFKKMVVDVTNKPYSIYNRSNIISQIEDFTIISKDKIFKISHPFPKSENGEDNRIPYLLQLLDDFENNYEKVNTLMKQTNQLWKKEQLKLN